MATENAMTRYVKKNIVSVPFRLNRKTDADIIEHLQTIDNRQGYVKRLIRDDIARGAEDEGD
jgi:hypothetical protein